MNHIKNIGLVWLLLLRQLLSNQNSINITLPFHNLSLSLATETASDLRISTHSLSTFPKGKIYKSDFATSLHFKQKFK